jgi:hypothetical protein
MRNAACWTAGASAVASGPLFWLTVVLPLTAAALVVPVTPKDARRPFGEAVV